VATGGSEPTAQQRCSSTALQHSSCLLTAARVVVASQQGAAGDFELELESISAGM
jgi:hypothetical protein